jgi:IS5 family transposase
LFTEDYRGHNFQEPYKVYKSGQRRGVTAKIKKELKRRSAIEPIIGHVKQSHKLGRHRLKGRVGDKINAVFATIGFNFKQILNWIKKLFCILFLFCQNIKIAAINRQFLNPLPFKKLNYSQ